MIFINSFLLKIQNEEITSSNIGETKKEQNNGHCEGDAKDVSNLTAGTKTEADDEESKDKTTNNESDNVNCESTVYLMWNCATIMERPPPPPRHHCKL